MAVQIIFLGTGGDSYVVGSQIRGSGGIIIKTEKRQFHIDPGPGSLVRASQCRINVRNNDVILVSHNHVNHACELNALIEAMTLSGFEKKGILVSTNQVINGDENSIPVLDNFHKECLLKYMVVKPGERVGIDDVDIIATKTMHHAENVGFKILYPAFTLSYVSDTSYFRELAEEHRDSDILILNVVGSGNEEIKGNLNSEGAEKLISAVQPKLTVITHFGKKMIDDDPVFVARELQKKTGFQVIAAKDGMTINPSSYSANSPQKRIVSY
ncbi:MAG: MBL fold metallo-hydrolase [Candidatus Woesearchaeota archaeon]|nr:MBL fold metallo-hydrolase [Candidatus Woesearchaeota archaeon]